MNCTWLAFVLELHKAWLCTRVTHRLACVLELHMVSLCTRIAIDKHVYTSYTWLACVHELLMVGLCTLGAHG